MAMLEMNDPYLQAEQRHRWQMHASDTWRIAFPFAINRLAIERARVSAILLR